jgi:hypothetical protein
MYAHHVDRGRWHFSIALLLQARDERSLFSKAVSAVVLKSIGAIVAAGLLALTVAVIIALLVDPFFFDFHVEFYGLDLVFSMLTVIYLRAGIAILNVLPMRDV